MKTTLILAALAAAPPALAASDSLTVEVEIAERDAERQAAALKLALSIAGANGCAETDTHHGGRAYEVKVCRDGGDAGGPILRMAFSTTGNSAGTKLNASRSEERRVGKECRL